MFVSSTGWCDRQVTITISGGLLPAPMVTDALITEVVAAPPARSRGARRHRPAGEGDAQPARAARRGSSCPQVRALQRRVVSTGHRAQHQRRCELPQRVPIADRGDAPVSQLSPILRDSDGNGHVLRPAAINRIAFSMGQGRPALGMERRRQQADRSRPACWLPTTASTPARRCSAFGLSLVRQMTGAFNSLATALMPPPTRRSTFPRWPERFFMNISQGVSRPGSRSPCCRSAR